MNLIRRFLSGYTENFLLAVTLWPLASLALVDDFRRECLSTVPQLAFNVALFMPYDFI